MPQVASTPVISPPVRSDAPGGAPKKKKKKKKKKKVSPLPPSPRNHRLPAAQEDQVADLVQTANASIPPIVAIDLALLARALSVEGSAVVPVAVTETDGGEPTASGDANTEDTKTQANGDTTSVSTDPKGAEVALTVGLAPPPAPAALPVQTDADVAAISSGG